MSGETRSSSFSEHPRAPKRVASTHLPCSKISRWFGSGPSNFFAFFWSGELSSVLAKERPWLVEMPGACLCTCTQQHNSTRPRQTYVMPKRLLPLAGREPSKTHTPYTINNCGLVETCDTSRPALCSRSLSLSPPHVSRRKQRNAKSPSSTSVFSLRFAPQDGRESLFSVSHVPRGKRRHLPRYSACCDHEEERNQTPARDTCFGYRASPVLREDPLCARRPKSARAWRVHTCVSWASCQFRIIDVTESIRKRSL